MRRIALALALAIPAVASADKKLESDGSWDCNKDPNVSIGNGAGKYTIKGACKKVSIGGGENTVTIESVDVLDVGGAENKITVDTVGTINVGGADNTITWKKAKTGAKPTLKGQPDKNKITQAK